MRGSLLTFTNMHAPAYRDKIIIIIRGGYFYTKFFLLSHWIARPQRRFVNTWQIIHFSSRFTIFSLFLSSFTFQPQHQFTRVCSNLLRKNVINARNRSNIHETTRAMKNFIFLLFPTQGTRTALTPVFCSTGFLAPTRSITSRKIDHNTLYFIS